LKSSWRSAADLLIHDRDPLFTTEFLQTLADCGVVSVKLPPVFEGTLGLASPRQEMPSSSQNPKRLPFDCAVCVPPRAQLRLHDISEHIQRSLGVRAVEEVTFVERSADAFIHRDTVRFSNGRHVLLQHLHVGQRVDVLSLSSGSDDREAPKDWIQEDQNRRVFVGQARLLFSSVLVKMGAYRVVERH
jgi:hypothetical protein